MAQKDKDSNSEASSPTQLSRWQRLKSFVSATDTTQEKPKNQAPLRRARSLPVGREHKEAAASIRAEKRIYSQGIEPKHPKPVSSRWLDLLTNITGKNKPEENNKPNQTKLLRIIHQKIMIQPKLSTQLKNALD